MSRVEEQSGVQTLQVTDELDLATTPALREQVAAALATGPRTLALDLSRCRFAGVDAVHALIDLTAAAQGQGTELVLVDPPPVLCRALDLIGLREELHLAEVPRPRRDRS